MCETIHKELSDSAKKHKAISHYTNIDAFEKIITNKSFRLTRLEEVNDLIEHKRLLDLWKKKVFVGCFTHRISESVALWRMYTGVQSGVSISFANCKSKLNT